MACPNGCENECNCCFDDGVATTSRQSAGCTVIDVKISSDACNTVGLGSDGGLLVKECAEVFEDSLCDDATDPATPFIRTTIIACDGTRTIVDTTPDGDPYVVVGDVVCCGSGGGVVPDVVTTLIETPADKTATYTNEIGTTTVLSETDFTANSQTIPATCEGLLADTSVLREIPVRWDTATNTYKAYDDGKTHSLVFEGPWNGTGFPSQTWNTGDSGSTPVAVMVINNPSACKPLNLHKYVTISANLVTNDNVNVPTIRWDGYFDNGTGVYFIDAQPRQSAVSNASGQIFYNSFGAAHRAPPSTIPPGGSHTYRSYITGTYEQGNSAGRISTFSSGYGLLNGIGVSG